jgi:tRNA(Ile)-lysidine synthetase-like protein
LTGATPCVLAGSGAAQHAGSASTAGIAGPMAAARRHDAQPLSNGRGRGAPPWWLLHAGCAPERPSGRGRWFKPLLGLAPEPRLDASGWTVADLGRSAGRLARSALPARLIVAFRRADGTVAGLPGGRKLKRALQESSWPPWRRSAVPLIYAGRRLLAVGDWWRAPGRAAGPSAARARRCRLRLHRDSAALI